MSNELLFEIGTEEIPAGFLSKAIGDMKEIIRKSLTEKRIAFARHKMHGHATPSGSLYCRSRSKTGRPDHRKNGAGQKGRL